MRISRSTGLLAAVFVLTPVCAQASTVVDVRYPGAILTVVSDVNSSGTVVGYYRVGGSEHHALKYEDGMGFTDLGASGGARGDRESRAYAIGGSGAIVGYRQDSSYTSHAVQFQPGEPHDIPAVGFQEARAINSSGIIAGTASTGNGDSHAQTYSLNSGAIQDLGTLGGAYSYGIAINEAGTVVGYSQNSEGYYRAFQYTPGNGPMAELSIPGYRESYASGINYSGTVVGYSYTATGATRAFIYDNNGIRDLGADGSVANDIIDAGFIVGDSGGQATIWRPDGSAVNLNQWLAQVDPDAAALWTLQRAVAISENGWIVGEGSFWDGGIQRFNVPYRLDASAVIPEPGAAGALLAGALGILCARPRFAEKGELNHGGSETRGAINEMGW